MVLRKRLIDQNAIPFLYQAIGETIAAMNDARLEVLVIPPDLLDRLKKKGGLEKSCVGRWPKCRRPSMGTRSTA